MPFEEGGRADEHFFMFRVATEALGTRGRDSARRVAQFLENAPSRLSTLNLGAAQIVLDQRANEPD